MRYREVARALEAEGWTAMRQTGSHVIFERDGRICPVPNHGGPAREVLYLGQDEVKTSKLEP